MKRKQKQKQARMMDQSSSMANLPSHILMEIISRLPIQSVMAIRCVCKPLLDIVSDSHFQVLHSTRAPTELLVHGRGMSTTLCIAEFVFLDDSLTAVDEKTNGVVFKLSNFSVGCYNNCNFGATQTMVSFVNSCYGLVCFRGPSGNMFAVICNPFTPEYITFPCPSRTDKTIGAKGICYGLGFSPKDNKFKLLRLKSQNYVDTDLVRKKTIVVGEIYTFGEKGSSWKTVANCPHVYMTGEEVVIFHEGALHWYCTKSDAIVTFDFDTELFGKLVTPPCMGDMTSSAIGVFDNCLFTTGCVGDFVDIWVLKEYDQGCWVKIFSIQKDDESFSNSYEPFKYLQNGEVLMFKRYAGIVCFNPDTGSVKNVGGNCRRYGAVFIRPSLVSLKVLLGDNVKVRSVSKPWYRKKAATIPHVWTSSVAVKDAVKADKDSRGCVSGSSAPKSPSEASASTSHPTEEKVKDDVLPAILASQQDGADIGIFRSQDPKLPKDRRVGLSSSETQKLADEIETLKAEDERKGKAIETLNVEIDRMGKVIDKLKQRKKEDRAFMRFMYQQMLNVNPNMPACSMPDNFSSSNDSDSD